MKITTEQIDAWLADAKQAQGKWVYSANQGVYSVHAVGEEDISPCVYDWCNAVHITNLCPANAIAILEELKELRLLAEKIKWHEDNLGGTPTYILDMVNK